MTVAELGRRMTASEFAEWIAYSRVEPFGDRRADQRAWLAVAAMGNIAGGGSTDLREVLPEFTPPATPDEVAAQVRAFFELKMSVDARRAELEGEA